MTLAIARESGIPMAEARSKIHLVDSAGLVTATRSDALAAHKRPYAHPHGAPLLDKLAGQDELLAAVEALRPTVLVGYAD